MNDIRIEVCATPEALEAIESGVRRVSNILLIFLNIMYIKRTSTISISTRRESPNSFR